MKEPKEQYIALELVVAKESNQYSSWCPKLDIASCGDNPLVPSSFVTQYRQKVLM